MKNKLVVDCDAVPQFSPSRQCVVRAHIPQGQVVWREGLVELVEVPLYCSLYRSVPQALEVAVGWCPANAAWLSFFLHNWGLIPSSWPVDAEILFLGTTFSQSDYEFYGYLVYNSRPGYGFGWNMYLMPTRAHTPRKLYIAVLTS